MMKNLLFNISWFFLLFLNIFVLIFGLSSIVLNNNLLNDISLSLSIFIIFLDVLTHLFLKKIIIIFYFIKFKININKNIDINIKSFNKDNGSKISQNDIKGTINFKFKNFISDKLIIILETKDSKSNNIEYLFNNIFIFTKEKKVMEYQYNNIPNDSKRNLKNHKGIAELSLIDKKIIYYNKMLERTSEGEIYLL